MDHERAFLRAVLENPDDDAPRLLYADWLEERGDPRGEFIRVQIAHPKLKCAGFASHASQTHVWITCRQLPGECPRCDLMRRDKELWEKLRDPILSPLCPDGIGSVMWTCRRGFPDKLECTAAAWLAHADALVEAAPIREVGLTTWPTVGSYNDQANRRTGYWLHGRHESVYVGEIDRFYDRRPPGVQIAEITRRLLAAEWPRITFTLPTADPIRAGQDAAEVWWWMTFGERNRGRRSRG